MPNKYNNKQPFEPILPGPKDWPVVQLSKTRKEFIEKVRDESIRHIEELRPTAESLIRELEITRYNEKLRIEKNPWEVDPEDEKIFWKNIKSKLIQVSDKSPQKHEQAREILGMIIQRYAEEIAGNFNPSYYKAAREIVTFGFARLLNAAQSKYFAGLFRARRTLRDKIRIRGYVQELRSLARLGTVVILPTHFSNLDSILIGWILNELGLPPFIYGAGLNLFNMKLFAYFMNSVGAYKVDRRKKNLLYLETLKMYSNMAIQQGCHSLFFPGGTRSRSGMIEKSLKLGLLGTALEAQRTIYAQGRDTKIFVVPLVINYNFVLEAPSLISQYLQHKGQGRYYIEADEFTTSAKIFKFLIKFFTKQAEISVTVGRGMDLFGNYVDEQGHSLGKNGTQIHTKDYFLVGGRVTSDKQREEEYTRQLSKRIIEEFHKFGEVLPSHLVAFVAYLKFRRQYPDLDMYNFLRSPEDEMEIDQQVFEKSLASVRDAILQLESDGKICTSPEFEEDTRSLMLTGIKNLGMYHARRPLLLNKSNKIITKDLNLLYYYHNRLVGYNLEHHV